MSDRLYVSLAVKGGLTLENQYRAFEKLLRSFPFSKLATGESTLRIVAVNWSEPPLAEYPIQGAIDPAEVVRLAAEFRQADASVQLDAYWDLWSELDGEWKFGPAPVSLTLLGAAFDEGSRGDEDFRIEFGDESRFLPSPDGARMAQENIRSLLRLVEDLGGTLPLRHKRLETESGENFAEKLKRALTKP